LILNVLWFIFGSGFLLAIGYGIAALICFALIVTIPFGVAALRLAVYSLWPFGRTVVSRPDAGIASGVANVIRVVAGAHAPHGRHRPLPDDHRYPVRHRQLQARAGGVLAAGPGHRRARLTSSERPSIMEITGIFTAIVIGLVIGLLGRLVLPGRQKIGFLWTILVGIVAAFIGTFIAAAVGVDDTRGVDWIELILQIALAAGGVALLGNVRRRS
jgi:uncharacterized membrane protein YeaQ/YmgE (transglycosylase-associated protein family)